MKERLGQVRAEEELKVAQAIANERKKLEKDIDKVKDQLLKAREERQKLVGQLEMAETQKKLEITEATSKLEIANQKQKNDYESKLQLQKSQYEGELQQAQTQIDFYKDMKARMGFDVTNDVFAKNAWYFRNSLVRANYRDVKNGVYEDMSFLETFLRNLLMGEHNELKNRYMHIRWEETTHSASKRHIERHIGQHIPEQNSILNLLDTKEISSKMKSNITKLYEAFRMEKIFGRSDVIEVLGITERPASTLLGKMYSLGLTEKITGAGKGKYRFIV